MDAAPAQLEDELEHARGDSRLASGRRVREDALEHLVLEYKPVQLGHVQHVRGRARRHRVAEALTAHDGERRVHRDALDRARDQVAIHGNHLLGDARYAHIRERLLASCLIAHRSPELLDVLEHGVNGPAAGWLERRCGLALSGRHRRKLGALLCAASTVCGAPSASRLAKGHSAAEDDETWNYESSEGWPRCRTHLIVAWSGDSRENEVQILFQRNFGNGQERKDFVRDVWSVAFTWGRVRAS